MKLRTKIQLFSSLFMLVLILLVNTSIYFLFYNITADSELEQLSAQTNTITETLNSNPDIPTSDLLDAYLPTDGMIRVIAEDESLLIPELKKPNISSELPSEFSVTETQTILSQENGADVAMISKPIIWNNGDVVTLQVSSHLLALEETMTTLFYVLVVASVIMLIPSIIAGMLLSRFLLRPIKALIQTMKENTRHAKWQKIDVQNRSRDELYEMEKTFNEMIDYLKGNFEKQEVFVSDASHELKTPISIVKSYAQLLERRGKENPEVFNESVEAIDSEADRMQKLVEQMLSLAKNKTKAAMQQVDMITLSEETIATFQGAYDRNISFDKRHEKLLVNGNPNQLQQVVYILIDNALKYSNDEIKIVIDERNNEAIFQVTDYGQGIPEKEQERIFDRFYRMDKARSRDTGGTGLGLAIANTITDAHNGRLFVTSNVGEGSTFTLTLPLD
ncbi:signal transduction histidine kinase [Virgibacillus natechei]|uniref:Signal transduction histidine-protein kinase ArlS n=1 Tax=Virgibacillus natechei TaxID=1216297 RepID=A0ABS4ICJ7_9BACI|nr:HAMP domain-containing histidine kinase [Virgibacillus natechei]MBP1968638.1 signal transduction histidine kinase [Virgibacillus natechei]UZD13743.1 HAMP domain-containing histidine kinase [Virgibacillus natechei]